jgi:hypothetical protein
LRARAEGPRIDELLSRSGLADVHVDPTTGVSVDQVATVIVGETHLEI